MDAKQFKKSMEQQTLVQNMLTAVLQGLTTRVPAVQNTRERVASINFHKYYETEKFEDYIDELTVFLNPPDIQEENKVSTLIAALLQNYIPYLKI